MRIEVLRARLTPTIESKLLSYTRTCIAYHTGALPTAIGGPNLDHDLDQARPGLFVSLHSRVSDHDQLQLRGCIGRITGGGPRLLELIHLLSKEAALHDPRFAPVKPTELAQLHVELSILSEPIPIQSAQELLLGTHGIVLKHKGHSAVFLPQVAPQQEWTLEQTLEALCRKAGLPEQSWQDPGCTLEVFEAVVFGEA